MFDVNLCGLNGIKLLNTYDLFLHYFLHRAPVCAKKRARMVHSCCNTFSYQR